MLQCHASYMTGTNSRPGVVFSARGTDGRKHNSSHSGILHATDKVPEGICSDSV